MGTCQSQANAKKIKIAYNSFRIFFGFSRTCSISNMFVTTGIPSYAEIYSFWRRVENLENVILKHLAVTWYKFVIYTHIVDDIKLYMELTCNTIE